MKTCHSIGTCLLNDNFESGVSLLSRLIQSTRAQFRVAHVQKPFRHDQSFSVQIDVIGVSLAEESVCILRTNKAKTYGDNHFFFFLSFGGLCVPHLFCDYIIPRDAGLPVIVMVHVIERKGSFLA